MPATQGLKVLQERTVPRGPEDLPAPKEREETKARPDPQAGMVSSGREGCLEPLDQLGNLERTVTRARLDHRAKRASKEARDSRVHREPQVPKA